MKLELVKENEETETINLNELFGDNTYFDWWQIDSYSYALSFKSHCHYIIQYLNEAFHLYEISTDYDDKYFIPVFESRNVYLLKRYIEEVDIGVYTRNQFVLPNTKFKVKLATDKQKRYYAEAVTHWDVHKHFECNKIKKIIKENVTEEE